MEINCFHTKKRINFELKIGLRRNNFQSVFFHLLTNQHVRARFKVSLRYFTNDHT